MGSSDHPRGDRLASRSSVPGAPLEAVPHAPAAPPALPRELAACLSETAFMSAFRRLQVGDQKNFIRWVSNPKSTIERSRRARILHDALDHSLVAWETRPDLPNSIPG